MTLPDQLHCPGCQSRLAVLPAKGLRCTRCERVFPMVDGIVDFAGDDDANRPHGPKSPVGPSPVGQSPVGPSPVGQSPVGESRGGEFCHPADTAGLFARMRTAAGDRWPAFLGDTMAFGGRHSQTIEAIAAGGTLRFLLVLDTAMDTLLACRTRITALGLGQPVAFATVADVQTLIRDSVADTVICTGTLSGVADVRAFLAMVYRVLKPGGRAAFVVPNRRYWEAMCSAMAASLVQLHARERVWPDGQPVALEILAHTRRLLVHRDDTAFLSVLKEKHLFDSEALEDLGREIGFATVETIPLDPDPAGADTTRRICWDAGVPDGFTSSFGALAASVGQPFFNLLGRQDGSASMLLWLTKARGPAVRLFSPPLAPPPVAFAGPDAALGGAVPRWSVELLARDTQAGIVVTLGGWCLCNVAVRWLRLTLDGVARQAPVWRPRPDVHEVLNGSGLYHPLNALCSGLDSELLFADVHAANNVCPFRLEIVLASGPVVTGDAPEMLVMDEQMVVAH